MARTLTITYGTFQVGATQSNANIYLTDKYREFADKDEVGIEFTVVISASTAADYLTAQTHMLGQIQVPDQNWSVALGGNRVSIDADDTDNTGFLTRATARKVGGVSDTAKSAEWVITLTAQLPATYDSRAGRREAFVEIREDASERQIARFTGVYTAVTTKLAPTQYADEVATFANSHLTDIGGTWNLIRNDRTYDDNKKVLRFEREYEKILKDESQAGTDHAAIALQQLSVLRRSFKGDRRAAEYADLTSPFDRISIQYKANIKIAQTTDLEGFYESTVRPHLLAQATDMVIDKEERTFDVANNVILANISGHAEEEGVLQSEVSTLVARDEGLLLIPAWDGNPFSRWEYQGPKNEYHEVNVRLVQIEPQTALPEPAIRSRETNPRLRRIGSRHGQARSVVGEGAGTPIIATVDIYAYTRAQEPQTGADGDGGADGLGFADDGDETAERLE